MANLKNQDQVILEGLFRMDTGLVMDFKDRDFERFVENSIDINVYKDSGFKYYCSQAKKLRQIWDKNLGNVVGILIEDLLAYFEETQLEQITSFERKRIEEKIGGKIEEKIEEMKEVANQLQGKPTRRKLLGKQEDTLQILLEDINKALAKNKPDLVLARLCTFSTKLLRQICADNEIGVVDDKGTEQPLPSLVEMLFKKYEQNTLFQSSFTLMAIQNSVSLFDKYNSSVCNNQSPAHDNDILGAIEMGFAVRIMADLLVFIDKVETYRKESQRKSNQRAWLSAPY